MRHSRTLAVLLALCAVLAGAAAAGDPPQPSEDLVACLRAAAPQVFLPGDAGYGPATLVYNRDHQRRPLAVVEVETAAHIQAVVACGRAARRRVVARAGGHGFEGAAVGDGVVVVDLRRMRGVQISPDKATASVEAGATLGDMYYQAWTRARRGVAAGSCPGVGVSGMILGGGYGFWARKYGLACDRVASFDVVTAEGTLLKGVTAAGPHADLFWASCGGGGGNFGIVTRWTVRLFALPPAVQHVTVEFPTARAPDLWAAVQRWGLKAPADVGVKVTYDPAEPAELILYSLGTDLKKVFAGSGVAALGPTNTTFRRFSWIEAVMDLAPKDVFTPEDLINTDWRAQGAHRKEKSFYLAKPLALPVMRRLVALLAEQPSSSAIFHPYGGAIAAKANNATAFPHRRGVIGLVQLQIKWKPGDAAGRQRALAWAAKATAFMAPYQVGSYVNYVDADIKNWQRGYYGGNYARLQAVKQAYDPAMFFAYPGQAIRPVKEGPCVYQPCV